MSSQYWKVPRSNAALAQQWFRRVRAPLPFVLEEVNKRMLTRAQIMRPIEGGVVHQGWLHPATLPELKALFAGRQFTALAPAAVELPATPDDQAATSFLSKLWPGRSAARAINEATAVTINHDLPLGDASQAMVWSPLWLHAVEDPGQYLAQWWRVLKPEGGVFFSSFGPDTAKELKGFADTLNEPFPDFADMHDIGDLMARQGFSDPVMEMEKLTLTYATPESLLADWRALLGNSLQQRQKSLRTPARYRKAIQVLEGLRNLDTGRIPLTFELVYGHAWKVQKLSKIDVAVVKISDIKGRKGSK